MQQLDTTKKRAASDLPRNEMPAAQRPRQSQPPAAPQFSSAESDNFQASRADEHCEAMHSFGSDSAAHNGKSRSENESSNGLQTSERSVIQSPCSPLMDNFLDSTADPPVDTPSRRFTRTESSSDAQYSQDRSERRHASKEKSGKFCRSESFSRRKKSTNRGYGFNAYMQTIKSVFNTADDGTHSSADPKRRLDNLLGKLYFEFTDDEVEVLQAGSKLLFSLVCTRR